MSWLKKWETNLVLKPTINPSSVSLGEYRAPSGANILFDLSYEQLVKSWNYYAQQTIISSSLNRSPPQFPGPLRQILEFVQPRQTWRHMMHYSFLRQLLCFIQISFFSLFFALVPSYRPRAELAQKRCLRRLIPLHLHWLWFLYNFLKDEGNFTKIRYH